MSEVRWPVPLIRQKPWFPGQPGVYGTDSERGLRSNATGAIFYVDPNSVDPHDGRDGTDPEAPLATVGAALTHCEDYRGDTIAVMANGYWTYQDPAASNVTPVRESVTVEVGGVRIVGVSKSASLGVGWEVPTSGATCITVNAMDVLIEGFAFMGHRTGDGGQAIYGEWYVAATPRLYGENLTVRHCYFDWYLDVGIGLAYNYFTQIHDNWFGECIDYHIYADDEKAACNGLRIFNNYFNTAGITSCHLERATYCQVFNNWFFDEATAGGVAKADAMINLDDGGDNLVHQNVMSCPLPGPVNAYDVVNTSGAGDAWIQNLCLNGPSTTNPPT